jgi:hypothetical protein
MLRVLCPLRLIATRSGIPALTMFLTELRLRPARVGSIVEVKRIQGLIFNTKEAAEQHGLELRKDWIDKRLDPSQPQR